MENEIVEVKDLEKTFLGFADIPKGDANTAYVFFQSKDNSKYAISTEKRKIMSAQLRVGKYDRIMTIHCGEFKVSVKKEIACEEAGHSFFADIEVRYFIQDPEMVYKSQNYHISEQIENRLSEVEFELGQRYGFRDQAGLKKEMYGLITEKLRKISFLRCTIQLGLDVDENARTIIQREHSHEYSSINEDLSAVERQTKMMNESELKQMQLEQEKRTAALEAELQTMKMDQIGNMIKKFGVNAGNMIDHVNGNMSGKELSQAIERTLRENRNEQYNIISKSYGDGMISGETAEDAISSMIGTDERKNLSGFLEEKQVEEDSEQKPEKGAFQWNDADGEDDALE